MEFAWDLVDYVFWIMLFALKVMVVEGDACAIFAVFEFKICAMEDKCLPDCLLDVEAYVRQYCELHKIERVRFIGLWFLYKFR